MSDQKAPLLKALPGLAGSVISAFDAYKNRDFTKAIEILQSSEILETVKKMAPNAVDAVHVAVQNVESAQDLWILAASAITKHGAPLASGAIKVIKQIALSRMGSSIASASLSASPFRLVSGIGQGIYQSAQLNHLSKSVEKMSDNLSLIRRATDDIRKISEAQIFILQKLTHNVDALQANVQAGFASIHHTLNEQESRRFFNDIEDLTQKLTHKYQDILEDFASNLAISESAIDSVSNISGKLIQKTNEGLSQCSQLGDSDRLPFITTRVFALRGLADVQQIHRKAIRERTRSDLQSALRFVEDELHALIQQRTLFDIGAKNADLISQYIYLRRGLIQENPDIGSAKTTNERQDQPWDDGLSALREVLLNQGQPTITSLPLVTLNDLRWYTTWKGLDEACDDIRAVNAVQLQDISDSLGVPFIPRFEEEEQLQSFLAIALPVYEENVKNKFQDELGWNDLEFKKSIQADTSTNQPSFAQLPSEEEDSGCGFIGNWLDVVHGRGTKFSLSLGLTHFVADEKSIKPSYTCPNYGFSIISTPENIVIVGRNLAVFNQKLTLSALIDQTSIVGYRNLHHNYVFFFYNESLQGLKINKPKQNQNPEPQDIISEIFFDVQDVYVKGRIPEKKLKNAVSTYAKNFLPQDILALCDLTVWGSAKHGWILTSTQLIGNADEGFDVIDIAKIKCVILSADQLAVDYVKSKIKKREIIEGAGLGDTGKKQRAYLAWCLALLAGVEMLEAG